MRAGTARNTTQNGLCGSWVVAVIAAAVAVAVVVVVAAVAAAVTLVAVAAAVAAAVAVVAVAVVTLGFCNYIISYDLTQFLKLLQ